MESTLALQLSDYAAEVGHQLGYGRLTTAWSGWVASTPYVPDATLAASQLADIMMCVDTGQRQVYWPPSIDGAPYSHKWSFLTPVRTLAVVADTGVYDLPDDFQGLIGEISYQPTDTTYQTLKRVGIDLLNVSLQRAFGTTGKPVACAIFDKYQDGVQGQRRSISFCPVPDASYTFTYRANVLPNKMTSTRPYPWGGAGMAELIMQSCRAAAEHKLDGERGVEWQAFITKLQAAISADVRDRAPDFGPYIGDPGVANRLFEAWCGPYQGTIATAVTYEGSAP